MSPNPKLLLPLFLHLTLVLFLSGLANAQGLSSGFYGRSCPPAEDIVKNVTKRFVSGDPTLAAPLLRMHFHDCFVRGCDGSVLLNSTSNNTAEKDAFPNLSLRGFQVIDAVKIALEEKCPGIVSCADILALVARDAVSEIKGVYWPVPTGRRDGRVSIAQEALNDLPPPFSNITQLKTTFAAVGLNDTDLVVLSGGHTIGISHCSSFSNRLYNFTGRGDADPSMDPTYVTQLRGKCPQGDTTTTVEMDPGSSLIFDTDYYSLVSSRRGLFQSDAALLNDNATRAYVQRQVAATQPTFFGDFAFSMVKMGRIGILTGTSGEIRKQCALIN